MAYPVVGSLIHVLTLKVHALYNLFPFNVHNKKLKHSVLRLFKYSSLFFFSFFLSLYRASEFLVYGRRARYHLPPLKQKQKQKCTFLNH